MFRLAFSVFGKWALRAPIVIAAAGLGVFILTSAPQGAVAQDRAELKSIAFGKKLYLGKANCVFCHGWAADGRGNERASVAAPSLRTTLLDRDGLDEVIRCGRLGTGMPFHDRFAYTDERCFGITREEAGTDIPPASDKGLQKREVKALLNYLEARIIGRPRITVEECVEFWGRRNALCDEVAVLERKRAEKVQTN